MLLRTPAAPAASNTAHQGFCNGAGGGAPTGEIIRTGTETYKAVVGYDLTRLLCGSEGTLGVITKIIFKLLPLPETKKTMLTIFDSIDGAARRSQPSSAPRSSPPPWSSWIMPPCSALKSALTWEYRRKAGRCC
jgi:FAD/FMN-containing dehydrogenase